MFMHGVLCSHSNTVCWREVSQLHRLWREALYATLESAPYSACCLASFYTSPSLPPPATKAPAPLIFQPKGSLANVQASPITMSSGIVFSFIFLLCLQQSSAPMKSNMMLTTVEHQMYGASGGGPSKFSQPVIIIITTLSSVS